jgi:dienelactone hydrolase
MKKIKLKTIYILLQILTFGAAHGQQKKELKHEDYKLWENLESGKISPNGKWITYTMHYSGGASTLFLKNTIVGLTHDFASGYGESFAPKGDWFAHMQADTIQLLNMRLGTEKSWKGYAGCSFLGDGGYLTGYDALSGKLLIVDLRTLLATEFEHVVEFKTAAKGIRAAMITETENVYALKVITFGEKLSIETLPGGTPNKLAALQWNDPGQAFGFSEEIGEAAPGVMNHKVQLWKCTNGKFIHSATLDPLKEKAFPAESYIPVTDVNISDDATFVFFDIRLLPKTKEEELASQPNSTVQIWRSDDKQMPPPKHSAEYDAHRPKWSVWRPSAGTIQILMTAAHPEVVLTGDEKHALVFSHEDYMPKFLYHGEYMDLYIIDIATGIKKLVAQKVRDDEQTVVSPAGKYIAYFKDRQWWVYDIAKAATKCVTGGINLSWERVEYDFPGEKPPYLCQGWTENDEQLLLCDQFDVWAFSPDGKKAKRLTEGREANVTWRVWFSGNALMTRDSYAAKTTKTWSIKNGVLLNFVENGTMREGFSYYTLETGNKNLLCHDTKMVSILKATDSDIFTFMENSFEKPPAISIVSKADGIKEIVQSNKQQSDYYWGKSELIHYTTPDGKQLKGYLLWPANYVAGKKYPMIVQIYQKLSQNFHQYEPPSLEMDSEMNLTNLTLEGYFVLQPDIVFTPHEPGRSALRCVTAAVEEVLKKGVIDKDNLGIIGHSFGAYETSLIVSQTDMFKAAVAGAGITDAVGYCLGLDGWGDTNFWRFEYRQMRIDAPYYGPEFRENSPVMNAPDIHTPLLLWVGNHEGNVPWWESLKLNNALWRLQKKCVFLVYDGEDHAIGKKENRIDLCARVLHWFNSRLKGEPAEDWAK